MKSRFLHIIAVILSLAVPTAAKSAVRMLQGSTYGERAASLINMMKQSSLPQHPSIKYVSPFYFARLSDPELNETAATRLYAMYDEALSDSEQFYASGSNMDFTVHATMHGYMLTKDHMPDSLRRKIRSFLEMGKYIRKNVTLNMRMMTECTGLLCAQEWEDFRDADGNDANRIREALSSGIVETIDRFVTHNCPEADAFTYIGTNLQYLRMLAEFCSDEKIRSSAENAYHHIMAQMLLPWNDGIYCSNPPRSKGWANLQTGNLATHVQISQLAWLFFGSKDGRPVETDIKNEDNFGCFNFWMAYEGKLRPKKEIEESYAAKQLPYSFDALRSEPRYFYSHHTFISPSYGLSTQHIEAQPGEYGKMQYTYAYKETKNLHLVWRSARSGKSVFSVCHDNPERPQPHQTRPNKLGYGENPYHRVFGSKRSAIGIYNVAPDYMDHPDFYRMYVPFSKDGIIRREVKKIHGMDWILCHTGEMMFAFATPEPWKWVRKGERFDIPAHDVLVLVDTLCRRGSWILETAETDGYREAGAADPKSQLHAFATDIATRTSVSLSDDYSSSDNPAITYTDLQGDTLSLTFFPPSTPYDGHYRLNGKAVDINVDNVASSPYLNQRLGERTIHLPASSTLRQIEL